MEHPQVNPYLKVTQRPLFRTALVVHGVVFFLLILVCIYFVHYHVWLADRLAIFGTHLLILGLFASLSLTWLYAKFAYGYGSVIRRLSIILLLLLSVEHIGFRLCSPNPYNSYLIRYISSTHNYDFHISQLVDGNSWRYYRFHFSNRLYPKERQSNPPLKIDLNTFIFKCTHGPRPWRSGQELDIEVLSWVVSLLLFPYPAIAFIRDRKRFRKYLRALHYGLCSHCDYDLTGNVSGICPECGNPCEKVAENSPTAVESPTVSPTLKN
ncbi:MAG: hypothetical protein FWC56_03850 [Phycisphaerae bacterium]|nr:hypothetical protein [Phycisphaerae bacterium]